VKATAEAVAGHGGPRSAGTRQAILEAARSAFAAQGYDRTTIRSVARTAGVDASMVMRCFGSKAGLFTAAATADLQVPGLAEVPAADRGEALVRHLVGRWEAPATGEGPMLLLRTATTSDEVAVQLQTVLGKLIAGSVASAGVDRVEERAGLIQAQMLGLALSRYILRQETLASPTVEQVVAAVAPSVQRYLETEDPVGDKP
jgi:AcrR family transcriptional regulator